MINFTVEIKLMKIYRDLNGKSKVLIKMITKNYIELDL